LILKQTQSGRLTYTGFTNHKKSILNGYFPVLLLMLEAEIKGRDHIFEEKGLTLKED